MRKLFLLLSMTAFLAVSCSKDDTETKQDLADQVVGIYSGKLTVTGAGDDDVQIRITKISATEIQIEPFAGDESSTFSARLVKDGEDIILTIPEQLLEDGSIRGNANILEGYPGAHGVYEGATKAFGYAIKVNVKSIDFDEIFIGSKK